MRGDGGIHKVRRGWKTKIPSVPAREPTKWNVKTEIGKQRIYMWRIKGYYFWRYFLSNGQCAIGRGLLLHGEPWQICSLNVWTLSYLLLNSNTVSNWTAFTTKNYHNYQKNTKYTIQSVHSNKMNCCWFKSTSPHKKMSRLNGTCSLHHSFILGRLYWNLGLTCPGLPFFVLEIQTVLKNSHTNPESIFDQKSIIHSLKDFVVTWLACNGSLFALF